MGQVLELKQPTALTEYARYFPGHTPSCFQQSLIEDTVTDLAKWRETLTFWAGNGYRPQSVQKMLDYYKQIGQSKWDVGKYEGPEPPPPKCLDCNDLGEVSRKKAGAKYEWDLEFIPCPKCQ